MTHIDATKRHDFVLLFDVTNGNPNGDPDNGNQPRVDPETNHGLVTDVALKRKVRDYAALYKDQAIFIQSQVALNTLILRAFRDTGVQPPQLTLSDEPLIGWFNQNSPEGFVLEEGALVYGGESAREADIRNALLEAFDEDDEDKTLRRKLLNVAKAMADAAKKQQVGRDEQMRARDRLCRDYYDIRMFGAVLSTGLNAGQVRGPVQLTFARSYDPITPLDLSITRQARTTTERMKTGSTEIGRKPIMPYGLYYAHGFYNPTFAEQTGVTDSDLGLLWEALGNMFEFDHSAARGEMVTRGLYIFTHDSKLGNAPSHRLFRRIQASRRVLPGEEECPHEELSPPRVFEDDYEVKVDTQDLPSGVTLTQLWTE